MSDSFEIVENGKPTPTRGSATVRNAQTGQSAKTPPEQKRPNSRSRNYGTPGPNTLIRHGKAGMLKKLQAHWEELKSNESVDHLTEMLVLTKDSNGQAFDYPIVVAYSIDPVYPTMGAYHACVLVDKFKIRGDELNSRRDEKRFRPSFGYSLYSDNQEEIESIIADKIGVTEIVGGDGSMVSHKFNYDDPEMIENMLWFAAKNSLANLNNGLDANGCPIDWEAPQDRKFNCNVTFQAGRMVTDASGLVKRADVQFDYSAIIRKKEGGDITEIPTALVSGYIDYVYTQPSQDSESPTNNFDPVFIVTDVVVYGEPFAAEVMYWIMRAYTTLFFADNDLNFAYTLMNSRDPMRDAGHFNRLANIEGWAEARRDRYSTHDNFDGSYYDLTSVNRTPKDIKAYFENVVNFGNMQLQLDVVIGGIQDSMFSELFPLAVEPTDSDNYATAVEALVESFDKFTDGKFSECFEGNEVTSDLPVYYYHVGYNVKGRNEVRDLSDVDTLYVMTASSNERGEDLENTILDLTDMLSPRLDDRTDKAIEKHRQAIDIYNQLVPWVSCDKFDPFDQNMKTFDQNATPEAMVMRIGFAPSFVKAVINATKNVYSMTVNIPKVQADRRIRGEGSRYRSRGVSREEMGSIYGHRRSERGASRSYR